MSNTLDPETCRQKFPRDLTCAGVLLSHHCVDGRLRYLVIHQPNYRRGPIGFPKGKIEAGETCLEAAMREFKEETSIGVNNVYWSQAPHIYENKTNGHPNVVYYQAYAPNTKEMIIELVGTGLVPVAESWGKLVQLPPELVSREVDSYSWVTFRELLQLLPHDEWRQRRLEVLEQALHSH